MRIRIVSRYSRFFGFGSFWAKNVIGFDHTHHCIECLIGDRIEQVNKRLPVNTDVDIGYGDGDIIYVCGVTYPYRWRNNFHLPVIGKQGAVAQKATWNGSLIEIYDAVEMPFDDSKAVKLYKDLGRIYTTCRNFQFGVYYFEGLNRNGTRMAIDELRETASILKDKQGGLFGD
jgi:hypothetical protein